MSSPREITERNSWTHYLAQGAMWSRFARIQKLHDSAVEDEDAYFVALVEFTLWAIIVDEGFEALLKGHANRSGDGYGSR